MIAMKKSSLVVLVLLAAYGVYYANHERTQSKTLDRSGNDKGSVGEPGASFETVAVPAVHEGSVSVQGVDGSLGDVTWGLTAWRPDGYYEQRYSVENYTTVAVKEWVTDPVDGSESHIQHLGTASFYIHGAAAARRNLFAFGGRARNGDLVIEAWELVDESDLGMSGAGFGVISQAYPLAPLVPRRFRKVEMYRGPSEPYFYDLEYDAQGRFLLILLGDGQATTLYRLEGDGSGALTVVAESVSTPEMSGMRQVQKFDQDQLGRVYALEDASIPYDKKVLITDSDNDGQFDPFPLVGDFSFFVSLGLEDFVSWNPLFGY